ncbi:MAG: hypothetical protein LBN33_11285 [Desulfovibrio sp.]|jgi:hypothetical protein|nr:hypothetical protein [Desulfovibrio sp.]
MEPESPVSQNAIGRILTATEVAAIFRVDVRTVRRYYEAFGGVRIGRAIRFYENRIVSMNDAYLYRKEKKLPEALERPGLDGRQNGGCEMVRRHKGRAAGRNRMGGADVEDPEKLAAKKLNALIPTGSCRKKLSVLEWGNAYLEECERRNTSAHSRKNATASGSSPVILPKPKAWRRICRWNTSDGVRPVCMWSGNNPLSIKDGVWQMVKINNRRLHFLTPREAKDLLAELEAVNPQLHDMALLSLRTGLRATEIFKLKGQDVDANANVLPWTHVGRH